MLANSLRAQTHHVVASSRRCLTLSSGSVASRTLSLAPKNIRYMNITRALTTSEDLHPTSTHVPLDGEPSSLTAENVEGAEEEAEQLPERKTLDKKATNTLFIGNLHGWTTEQEIKDVFSRFGDVSVRMKITAAGQNRGFAHVEYTSSLHAQKAMRRHKRSPFFLRERHLNLDYAESRQGYREAKREATPNKSLYVGNLPFSVDDKDIRQLLGPYGKIERVRFDFDEAGHKRGFAHVDFETIDDAQTVLDRQWERPFQLQKRTAFISFARAPTGEPRIMVTNETKDLEQDGSFRKHYPPNKTLWVGGMPSRVTEDDVRNLFEDMGTCEAIRLTHYKDDRPHSYAHVDFATLLEARRIMEEHMRRPLKLWGKKDVLLDYAPPTVRQDYPPHYVLFTPGVEGDDIDVRALFGPHAANIRRVRFHNRALLDPKTRPAFIEFHTVAQAMSAMNDLHGQEVKRGVRLSLAYARRPPSSLPPPSSLLRDTGDYGVRGTY